MLIDKYGRQPVEDKPHIFYDEGHWCCTHFVGDGVGHSPDDAYQDFVADRSYSLAQLTSSWAAWMAFRPRPSQWSRLCGLVHTLVTLVRLERVGTA